VLLLTTLKQRCGLPILRDLLFSSEIRAWSILGAVSWPQLLPKNKSRVGLVAGLAEYNSAVSQLGRATVSCLRIFFGQCPQPLCSKRFALSALDADVMPSRSSYPW
jgi:hypothetical protein